MLNTTSYTVDPQLIYNTTFKNKHNLTVLLGASYQYAEDNSLYVIGREHISDQFLPNAAAANEYYGVSNPHYENKMSSLFTRVNYDYNQRYIANVTIRRDGSSRFGVENRFGTFWAVGGGWIFSDEEFMKSQNIINYGKLRSSYGRTGNDNISDFAYLSQYGISGIMYDGVNAIYPSTYADPNIKWETTDKFDLGVELGLLNDRVSLSATYFRSVSRDLLRSTALSSQTGFDSTTTNINAEIENKGWELEVRSINVNNRGFKWTTNFNMTLPKNKLLSYEGLEDSAYWDEYEIGESISLFRGYIYTGIDNQTGVAQFDDMVDGVAGLSTNDRTFIGNSDVQMYGGLSNKFSIGSFEVDLDFYFKIQDNEYGYFYLNYMPAGYAVNTTSEIAENSWTTPGVDAKYPGITTSSSSPIYKANSSYLRLSDFALSNASYFKLQNLRVRYNLSKELVSRLNIQAASLYVQGHNLFTITPYDGLDPEVVFTDLAGFKSMPTLRSYTIGLNITF